MWVTGEQLQSRGKDDSLWEQYKEGEGMDANFVDYPARVEFDYPESPSR